jgi:hypothetical protein
MEEVFKGLLDPNGEAIVVKSVHTLDQDIKKRFAASKNNFLQYM